MTMRITVKNEDATRVCHAQLEEREPISGEKHYVDGCTLYAGEQHEFYIHAGRILIVTENANAQIPAL